MIDFDEWLYIFGSAHEARNRLKDVIAADRAAAPCWRWVKLPGWTSRYSAWAMQNANRAVIAVAPPPSPFDNRPRYRWSERR